MKKGGSIVKKRSKRKMFPVAEKFFKKGNRSKIFKEGR